MTEQKKQMTPYPLGAHYESGGIRFSFISKEKDCGIILHDINTGKKIRRIPFLPNERIGHIYCKHISDIDVHGVSYQFYEGGHIVPDPYARVFAGQWKDGMGSSRRGIKYGRKRDEQDLKACFLSGGFHWGEDKNPRIPNEDCICYCLHVRGFTRHRSSGVSNPGTFAGMVEKLPYLKQLGITTLELQPAYEFLELPIRKEIKNEVENEFSPENDVAYRINYWGYKRGYYYAPKAGYTAGEDPSLEFKEMVKAFHENGLEIIMQFYFPDDVPKQDIQDILRFWIIEYHVDGFRLMGKDLPMEFIAGDAALADTKLWHEDFTEFSELSTNHSNLSVYRDDYMYEMRRFLKGDEDMLSSVLFQMRHKPEKTGRIIYFTNYYGFTMMDLVSYEKKRNEENGESNRDGSNYNISWNCGVEGSSRSKKILTQRKKQIKNAFSMLLLSQATPLFFMGDEFGNTQKGNNNPYCQDNEVAWLNWKLLEKNQDLFLYVTDLIRFRREQPILHQKDEMRNMDYLSCGYPDISYHGEKAWRPSMNYNDRHIGIMYCGKYVGNDTFIYVAYNMHWEAQEFAMPKLPRGKRWELFMKTDDIYGINESEGDARNNWQMRQVPGRSVAVFISSEKM